MASRPDGTAAATGRHQRGTVETPSPERTSSKGTRRAAGGRGGRKPGRPKDQLDMRERILDVAEQVFAEHGFSGATTRMIAEAGGVNPALIRYYFDNKEALFESVFKRRAVAMSGRRHVLLDALEARAEPPTVREIIYAYLLPQWEMKRSGAGGEAFVRLQARLHTEPAERAFRLRREVYDLSVKRYIAALRRALPHIHPDEISWRMVFLIGTYLYMLADVDRLNDFSDTPLERDDPEALLDHLVRFLDGGMRATAPPGGDGATGGL